MLLTGLFPFADYALPAIAGLFTAVVLIELNPKWSIAVYIATSILALLIVPVKESAILYVMLFGHYSIIKSLIERLNNLVLEWVFKILMFNAIILVSYFGMIYILGFTAILEEFKEFGTYGAFIFLALANVVFVIYDIAFTRLATYYCKIFRPKYLRRFL